MRGSGGLDESEGLRFLRDPDGVSQGTAEALKGHHHRVAVLQLEAGAEAECVGAEEVDMDVAGTPVALERPRSADDLISEADFDKDERLPYWADVWPSSTALAGFVAALDGRGLRRGPGGEP